jgi:hypothetical protein
MVAEMPMDAFKNEIKRLRIVRPPEPEAVPDLPFQLLGRHPSDGMAAGETWIVRGWENVMADVLAETGARVREVVHLDLEEAFVELLRGARPGRGEAEVPSSSPSPAASSSREAARGPARAGTNGKRKTGGGSGDSPPAGKGGG